MIMLTILRYIAIWQRIVAAIEAVKFGEPVTETISGIRYKGEVYDLVVTATMRS